MSIDWLFDLERDIENGKEVYACPGMGRNQWILGKPMEELRRFARKVVDQKKIPVSVVKVIAKTDAVAGDLFLVPTRIGDPGARGEPMIEWSTVDTREAAEMMRDVRHGPSPFFAMQVQETFQSE